MTPRRVALKVDCDTYVGTREGIPRLLEMLAVRGIRATFYFTLGPDRSGVAAKRFFTQPGFLKKMLKSGGASLYGFPTVLYGTLLPAPRIGELCEAQMRSCRLAGHDTGVHGWDHVGWHDALDRWSSERIRTEAGKAHEEYLRILGAPAESSAAPGWTANSRSLEFEETRNLRFTSNSRGGRPFFPSSGGRTFTTLEIPSTLPTLDETLAWDSLGKGKGKGKGEGDDAQLAWFRGAVRSTEVHTVHTEVEGRSKAELFGRILDAWKGDGVRFVTLRELADEALASRGDVPVRELVRTSLPGRGGTVATGWPEEGGRS